MDCNLVFERILILKDFTKFLFFNEKLSKFVHYRSASIRIWGGGGITYKEEKGCSAGECKSIMETVYVIFM